MKDKFKHLPDALQKQVVLRLAIGTGFFVLFLVVQFCMGDIYFSLPCVVFGGVMIVNGGLLFYNSTKGNFISVRGVCRQIETTGIRKRVRNLYIDTEPYILKLPVRQRIRNLDKGDTIIVYLSEKTPVYEQDNGYMICSYYALEIRKEA